jgi:general secretion pathway protein E
MDGRLSLKIDNRNVDVRVSITPGISGQLIVCRLLDEANSMRRLSDIEMSLSLLERFSGMITEPNGMFAVTGPVGSGKTTTLYAMLNELDDGTRNIITIEHPVEYRVEGIHQIEVDSNMTFAQALRAVLRQDPDVIMIGEIRDAETAQIAVQAALTGRLVLATLHANDAVHAITRLLDFKVDPMTLSAALRAISAQRLVRRCAPGLSKRTSPTDTQAAWLRGHNIDIDRDTEYPVAENHNDYKGFVPIMEMIMVDAKVRRLIGEDEETVLSAAATQPQFETLAQAAERLAYCGLTTLDEVARVISGLDSIRIDARRLGQIMTAKRLLTRAELQEILDDQAELRLKGIHKPLGQLLVQKGLCDRQTILDVTGYTSGAKTILERIVTVGDKRAALRELLTKWHPGESSLFEVAVQHGICTMGEIEDAVTI